MPDSDIIQIQRDLIAEFAVFDDWLDRYQYLTSPLTIHLARSRDPSVIPGGGILHLETRATRHRAAM